MFCSCCASASNWRRRAMFAPSTKVPPQSVEPRLVARTMVTASRSLACSRPVRVVKVRLNEGCSNDALLNRSTMASMRLAESAVAQSSKGQCSSDPSATPNHQPRSMGSSNDIGTRNPPQLHLVASVWADLPRAFCSLSAAGWISRMRHAPIGRFCWRNFGDWGSAIWGPVSANLRQLWGSCSDYGEREAASSSGRHPAPKCRRGKFADRARASA